MYQIIHSAKVVKCDETGDVGILVDGKVLSMGGTDWNASEGEAGHVKNRTHYEETTVVNEPLNITWDGNTEGLVTDSMGVSAKISDVVPTDEQFCTCEYGRALSSSFNITADKLTPMGDITLGGELVVVRKAGAVLSNGDMSVTFPETGIYAFISEDHLTWLTSTEPVPQTKTVVHKLDGKYLPEGLPYVEKGAEIVPETTCTFSKGQATMPCDFVFNIGEEYTVTWNGVEYVCVGYDADGVIAVGDASPVGGESTGEPFLFGAVNGNLMAYALSGDTSATFKITESKTHKLDKNFLPDNVGGAKRVTIGMDENDDYTASATYAEIAEWISADMDVKCVYGNYILPLVYSDEVSEMSMMELSKRHDFAVVGPNSDGNLIPTWVFVRIDEYDDVRVGTSELVVQDM